MLLGVLTAVSAGNIVPATADATDGVGVVTAVAGTGRAGSAGDGGPALDAELYEPRMVSFDAAGNMYIADTINHVIRVVDRTGTMWTVAGVAAPVEGDGDSRCPGRFSGDGGPALSATLACPHSVAVSPAGRLVIADSENHTIREVDSRGTIRTIAGTGTRGFRGDNGSAVHAQLADPKGILFDAAGNLYIADTNNHRVRKVDAAGTITTVAGTGARGGAGDGGAATGAQLWEPRTLAMGPEGELYIAESVVHRIRKVDADGIITRLAGTSVAGFGGDGGPAVDAQLDRPRSIDVDRAGVVYIADSGNSRIRKVGRDGIITTIAGTGSARSGGDGLLASEASFSGPAVTVVGTDLYVTDSFGHRIRRIKGITAGPAIPVTGTTTIVTSSGPTTSTTGANPTTTTTSTSTTSPTTAAPAGAGDPVTIPSGAGPGAPSRPVSGYWMLGSRGDLYAFGGAVNRGNAAPLPALVSAVDLEPTPSGAGYWVLTSDGNVRVFGDARALGGVTPGRLSADERVASLSATPSGAGYWVFTDRGRAIAFGDARFLGDVSALKLNGPVLDSVATPTGQGYYMVASDGGIFSFGDARFYGSTGDRKLNAPVQSLVPTADGRGYWLVASDGGIFAFSAPFRGSMGDRRLNQPVTGMVRFGDGYLMVASDGGVFNFSGLPFAGSLGASPPAHPIVSVAPLAPSSSP
jgi:hypothetical protein